MTTPSSELYRRKQLALALPLPKAPFKKIRLDKGMWAIVDREDYERLNKWKWHARFYQNSGRYYAHRTVNAGGGKYHGISMHNEVLPVPFGSGLQVDHRNADKTLDNRKYNLRLATRSQQAMNRTLRSDNTSGFKGVYRQHNKFASSIMFNGKKLHLGHRDTAEAAFRELYVPAAMKYHGEFARLG